MSLVTVEERERVRDRRWLADALPPEVPARFEGALPRSLEPQLRSIAEAR